MQCVASASLEAVRFVISRQALICRESFGECSPYNEDQKLASYHDRNQVWHQNALY